MSDIAINDFSYLEQYKPQISNPEFWQEVLVQLNKDFGREDAIKIAFESMKGDTVAELFVIALQKYLPEITPQLSEILYRIDVSESQVAALKDMPIDIYYRCLAEIVLKRTIQKVITRKMYSGKKIE
jgi:hypothetical protein